MAKVKTAICSRLFNQSIGRDCETITNSKRYMDYYSELASLTLARALRNQSDNDFDHYTILNDKASESLSKDFARRLGDNGLNTILVRNSDFENVLMGVHSGNEAVCFSKMDIDDFVHKDAVKLAKAAYVPGRLIAHGYSNGFLFDSSTGGLKSLRLDYKGLGHIVMMQSFLFDRSTPFYPPYGICHTNIKGVLKERNDKFADDSLIVYGDKDCNDRAYVYVRHTDALSKSFRFVEKGSWPKDLTEERFEELFGISFEELKKGFKDLYDKHYI